MRHEIFAASVLVLIGAIPACSSGNDSNGTSDAGVAGNTGFIPSMGGTAVAVGGARTTASGGVAGSILAGGSAGIGATAGLGGTSGFVGNGGTAGGTSTTTSIGAAGGNTSPSCNAYGQSCATGFDCCSGLCDAATQTCASQINRCLSDGQACASPTDCCTLNCASGKCGANQCVSDGGACTNNANCCGQKCRRGGGKLRERRQWWDAWRGRNHRHDDHYQQRLDRLLVRDPGQREIRCRRVVTPARAHRGLPHAPPAALTSSAEKDAPGPARAGELTTEKFDTDRRTLSRVLANGLLTLRQRARQLLSVVVYDGQAVA